MIWNKKKQLYLAHGLKCFNIAVDGSTAGHCIGTMNVLLLRIICV